MALIKEFKGLRPEKEFISRVSVLPYDVVSTEEARAAGKDNTYSFFHITKPEIDFSADTDPHDPRVFKHGKEYMQNMIRDGILVQDDTPSLYLYTQIVDGREQTGLIACVSIDDYLNRMIKKHELTREDKELERTRHTDLINANAGQVFLFYRDSESKRKLFEKAMRLTPEYDFQTGDGVRQVVRVIRDRDLIESFKSAFRDDVLYIADGHHRAASAVRVGVERRRANPRHDGSEEYNQFMAVIFPHSQLKILAYNRIVRDLNGLTADEFMKKISASFSVEKIVMKTPEVTRTVCMYLASSWYLLAPRFDPGDDPIDSLDVRILQEYLLGPVLGIKDPRTDKRIDFIGGKSSITELQKRVDSGAFQVAFSLYPTSIEQLMRVSDTDGIMPPKSTWFEPKLQSGIVVHLL